MEMRRTYSMLRVSLPFCLGVLAGWAAHWSAAAGDAAWIAAGGAMGGAAACLAAASLAERKYVLPVLATFFLLGLSASAGAAMSVFPERAGPLSSAAGKMMERFRGAICSVQYESGGTAGILLALLTGDREGLDAATVGAFRSAGASHILALSGLHLGIVYGIVVKMLSVLGNARPARTVRSAAAVAFAGFYTLMTGAGPSIVRAFLFITMNEILRLSPGRKRIPVNILCAALTIQLCLDPEVVGSLGFQLSYLSMTGITVLFPILEKWYPKSGRRDPVRAIWVSAALSVSCQVFTAPLVWIRFGTFPTYFLLTNLLALPLTEALMVSGLAATAFSVTGTCPQALVSLTDTLCNILSFSLETIASM